MRLSEKELNDIVRAKERAVVAVREDCPGLSLCVTPTSATWQLRYRLHGRAHWLTLGTYKIGLKEARKRALKARAQISEGICPESRRARAALKAIATFRELADDYLRRELELSANATDVSVQ